MLALEANVQVDHDLACIAVSLSEPLRLRMSSPSSTAQGEQLFGSAPCSASDVSTHARGSAPTLPAAMNKSVASAAGPCRGSDSIRSVISDNWQGFETPAA